MKDKIKKFCKEHPFVVGAVMGYVIADSLNYGYVKYLQSKGFMMVRPGGYEADGTFYAKDIRGGLHHVHNYNK